MTSQLSTPHHQSQHSKLAGTEPEKARTMSDERAPYDTPSPLASDRFSDLVNIMKRLRDPDGGCPWDVEQTFETIAPYTIEEAYEVSDAIDRGDMSDLRDELGDLLFQVVFHSQMASERGAFSIEDVVTSICEKMTRRHPHVFGAADQRSADEQTDAWEKAKAAERDQKAASARSKVTSALDGVALALPALLRAEKLQKRAARTGFDWTEAEEIFEKLSEETAEVRDAIEGGSQDEIEDEVGDLLFVAANLARRMDVDPEQALRRANDKFSRRFMAMEAVASERGETFAEMTLDAQEALWSLVKSRERPQTS